MPRWSYPYANSDVRGSILGASGPRAAALNVLADAGYDGVELWVRDPGELDWTAITRDLTARQLQLAAIGTGPMGTDDGLSLTARDDADRSEMTARFIAALEVGGGLGAPVMLGKQRGNLQHHPDAPVWQRDGLRRIYDAAERHSAAVVLEPQNSTVVDNINNAAEAVALQTQYGAQAGIMLDTFHMHLGELDPLGAAATAGSRLWHMHVADSDRQLPGRGTLPLRDHLQTLRTLGYGGFVSFEIEQNDGWEQTARAALAAAQT